MDRLTEVPLVIRNRRIVADLVPAFEECPGPIGEARYSCIGTQMAEFLEGLGSTGRAQLYWAFLTKIGRRVDAGELSEVEAEAAGFAAYLRLLAEWAKEHEVEIVETQHKPDRARDQVAAEYLLYWAKQERIQPRRHLPTPDLLCFAVGWGKGCHVESS